MKHNSHVLNGVLLIKHKCPSRLLLVTTCAPDFLHSLAYGLTKIDANYSPDIWYVHAHSECDRRSYGIKGTSLEKRKLFFLIVYRRMIHSASTAIFIEVIAELFVLLLRATIDYLLGVMLLHV